MSVSEIAGRAQGHAGGAALARVVGERSLMLRFAAGRPTQSTAIDDASVEIAVLREGHLGRATTNRTDDEGLRACARLAGSAADAASVTAPGAHPGFGGGGTATPADRAFDQDTARLDPDVGAAALAAAFEVADEAGVEAHGTWTAGDRAEAVALDDACYEERTTDAFMKLVCIDPATGRSGFAAGAASRVDQLDARALASVAVGRATTGGALAELAPGDYPVVLDHQAVGVLLELLGATALNGLAHAEGRGALTDRLGRQVTSSAINLADSPHSRLTLVRGFDAEGTAKRPIPLIQDGVAMNVVHDRRSAALAETDSTGHALEPGGAPDGPHPTNLVLAGGGAAGVDELCAPIERGIYVTRLWYANVVRPKETLITAVTRDGTFLIEDGAVTRPLRDMRLTDSLLGMLSRTQALTAAQRLASEGEFYGRRFAYGVVCPALRVESARFTALRS